MDPIELNQEEVLRELLQLGLNKGQGATHRTLGLAVGNNLPVF